MPLSYSTYFSQPSWNSCSRKPPGAFSTWSMSFSLHSPWCFKLNTSPEVLTTAWPLLLLVPVRCNPLTNCASQWHRLCLTHLSFLLALGTGCFFQQFPCWIKLLDKELNPLLKETKERRMSVFLKRMPWTERLPAQIKTAPGSLQWHRHGS